MAIKPKKLSKHATIGIISPASPQRNPDFLHKGIRYLESIGYRVEVGKYAFSSHDGYLAGTDEQRLEDLHSMFANPEINAIFCARGGYGTMRILDKIDYSLIERNPKIFVGFSDTTALQLALLTKISLVSFMGAMPAVDMKGDRNEEFINSETEEFFWNILSTDKPIGMIHQSRHIETLFPGSASGNLLPVNLSLLVALLGTEYLPYIYNYFNTASTDKSPSVENSNSFLLLPEDIGEDSYKIDRMLRQIYLSKFHTLCSGFAFGSFTDPPMTAATPQRLISSVLEEYAQLFNKPAISNILFGHHAPKLTLPMGIRASISDNALHLLESACQ